MVLGSGTSEQPWWARVSVTGSEQGTTHTSRSLLLWLTQSKRLRYRDSPVERNECEMISQYQLSQTHILKRRARLRSQRVTDMRQGKMSHLNAVGPTRSRSKRYVVDNESINDTAE